MSWATHNVILFFDQRLSEVNGGMAEFSGVTVVDNIELLVSILRIFLMHLSVLETMFLPLLHHMKRMFEANGEGSTTLIQSTIIERNTGAMAYQIFRITNSAEGSLRNSTIRSNIPVEV